MSGRILVADDSVTIQKVIEMTLSGEDCQLDSCLNEEELFKKLHSSSYDLIVMDFNLSPSRSGVEIAERIYSASPETPIMAMMGTFDSIDEASLEKTRIADKIVKPFNSKEFVEKCSNLLKKDNGVDIDDRWSIDGLEDHRKFQEKNEEDFIHEDDFPMSTNKLQQEMDDWGIGVPEVIGDAESDTAMESLPNIIEGEGREFIDMAIPQKEEGPEIKDLDNNSIDADEFWRVDEPDLDKDEDLKDAAVHEKKGGQQLPQDASLEQIQNSLKPALEEIVKKYCSQKVEEVAWEVIPDLAENLIRSEIKEISNRLAGK